MDELQKFIDFVFFTVTVGLMLLFLIVCALIRIGTRVERIYKKLNEKEKKT